MNKETSEKIQELQILEQNIQSSIMQKQTIQLELNETNNALEEIKKSKDDVFKIVGGIMIKSDNNTIKKELEEKNKILDLKIKTLEKQEKLVEEKANKIKQEINSAVDKDK